MKLADLKPAPFNPRLIKDAAVLGLAESLDRFGDISGIVWNKSNGYLVTGHQRLKALQARFNGGVTMAGGKIKTPAGAFAVRVVEWDDDKHTAAMISANNPAIGGEWDEPLLIKALETLDDYPTKALLMDDLPGATVEDKAAQEVDVEDWLPAKTHSGDVWKLGRHRLMCGDCTDKGQVDRLMSGAEPFIMVTDPPYGVDYDPQWREDVGHSTYGPQATGLVVNDDRLDWTEAYKLFPGHVAYVWHAGRSAVDIVLNLRDAEFEIRTQIIWRKPVFVLGRGHYHWQHEPCWYAVRSGGSAKWCGDRTQSTIWEIKSMHVMGGARNSEGNEVTGHSTQKPVECMARPIRNHGGSGDDVYDPFSGSGTTIIAAEQLDRTCYAMEIEPKYCDVALARWEKLTGQVAVLDGK